MRKEVKEKWVTALRSGEYEQGDGQLCIEYGGTDRKPCFCCLGVLTELAVKEGVVNWYDPEMGFAPPRVGEWAGLPEGLPEKTIGSLSLQEFLAGMNDDGVSFSEIADWIERYL